MMRGPRATAWDLGRLTLHAARRPLVMGIVNLTPDSFYPGARHTEPQAAVDHALGLLEAGADLLDLGAESTRPGAAAVPAAEEQARLIPVLDALRRLTDAPLSVDTRRAETASRALDAGADAINDISAGQDPGLLPLVADRAVGVVLMHMQGDPRTMQDAPRYGNAVGEVGQWLQQQAVAAEAAGIAPARIVVDPGIGFGKLLEHNLTLLADLAEVGAGRPLLVGASRKSFIGAITGAPVEERLAGSLATLAVAHAAGATVVRVHDVAASVQFLDVLAAIDDMRPDNGRTHPQ